VRTHCLTTIRDWGTVPVDTFLGNVSSVVKVIKLRGGLKVGGEGGNSLFRGVTRVRGSASGAR
jgi:hypothetical protein